MGEKIRLVIAEDHTILREGLRALLSSHSEFDIVGEAEDGRDAIRCVEKLEPDLCFNGSFHAENGRHFSHHRYQETISEN